MSCKQEQLVQRLMDLAGSPVVLHTALRELKEDGDPYGLEVLVRKIIAVRGREASTSISV
ncbi:MAG: hypothetical protein SF070_01205 [Gemmatimonadota bacterium]|nr:hypothetical protein [Gemmatimonadota bacterium]